MEEIIGDTHVHVPLIRNGTSMMVKSAIDRGLDFIVLAYDCHFERFDEFLEKPNLGPSYEVIPMGSVAKVIKGDCEKIMYVIRGEQITNYIDILAWPLKKEIIPDEYVSITLKMIKEQGALSVLLHPKQSKEECFSDMMHISDAIEYNCAPEMFVSKDNELAKKLAKENNKALIAGSDARMPSGIMPCTVIKCANAEGFWNLDDEARFVDYMRNKIREKSISIIEQHASAAKFMTHYILYAGTVLIDNPIGVTKSFIRSHVK